MTGPWLDCTEAMMDWMSAGLVGSVAPAYSEKKLATGFACLMLLTSALVVFTVSEASVSIAEALADLQTFAK